MTKILVSAFLLCVSFSSVAQKEQSFSIEHLTGDFYIYTTWQPIDSRPFPANGMYIVTSHGIVVIDSPWDTTQAIIMIDSIERQHHSKVVAAIATHYHNDRTGAFDIFRKRGIKTYSSKQTLELCIEKNEPQAQYCFVNDTIFDFGDHTLRTFYPGPGHAHDNIVLWFDKEKILYGGCMVKSCEANNLGNLSDADPVKWSDAIKRTIKHFPNPSYVICGHQDWKCKKSLDHTLKLIDKFKKSTPRSDQ